MTRVNSTPHFRITSHENSVLLGFKINRDLLTDYNRIISQGKMMTVFTEEFSNLANFTENFFVLFFRITLVSKMDDIECRNYI